MDAANRGAVERLKRKRFDSSGSSPDEDEPPAKSECAIFNNTWTLFNDNFTWIREKPQMARYISMSMLVIRLHLHGKHLRGHAGAWLRTLLQSHILNGWKTLSLDVFIRAVAELQNESQQMFKKRGSSWSVRRPSGRPQLRCYLSNSSFLVEKDLEVVFRSFELRKAEWIQEYGQMI